MTPFYETEDNIQWIGLTSNKNSTQRTHTHIHDQIKNRTLDLSDPAIRGSTRT